MTPHQSKAAYTTPIPTATARFNLHHVRDEIRRLRAAGVERICLLICHVDNLHPDHAAEADVTTLLLRTGHLLRTSLRTNDLVVRIAEDEFAVVMADADEPTGQSVIARLHERAVLLNMEDGPPPLCLRVDSVSGPPIVRRLGHFLEQTA